MNKAFTLIELLGVIIILAVIALITTPIITTVLKDNKESADVVTVESIIKAAKNYSAVLETDNEEIEFTINYTKNPYTLIFKGEENDKSKEFKKYINNTNIPDGGIFHMDDNGDIELKLWFSKESICIVKEIDNKKVSISKEITKKEECTIK